jgi:L-alanine-DL-glutamate epimerase-like enolase superfamily enzyme
MTIEYFHETTGVLAFDKLLARPLEFSNGEIAVPPGTGHGIELDPEAIRHYEAGTAQ